MFVYLMLAFLVDQQLIEELNRMRSNPAKYESHLEDRLKYYRKNMLRLPEQVPLVTQEGNRAVTEAIRVLRSTRPLPTLIEDKGLAAAARDHVQEIGPARTHATFPDSAGCWRGNQLWPGTFPRCHH